MTRQICMPHIKRTARAIVLLFSALVVSACTTVLARNPVPESVIDQAAPYGIQSENLALRIWGDAIPADRRDVVLEERIEVMRELYADEIRKGTPIVQTALALSGGGPDGAFGAGLLNGWSASGNRPDFTIVTGISTGAIIAVFAYLGPEYDEALTEVYTSYTTDELLTPTIFAALTGGTAVTDTRGYRQLIERYIDEEAVALMAERYRDGRVLLIGTTNLDASRAVSWNVGAIAATGHPDARRLIHDIIQASSAIPGAFPPVLIPVESPAGVMYDEMHVDGGATQQVMLFTPSFSMKSIDLALKANFERSLYVVMNNKLDKPYDPVRPRLLAIAGKSASSLLGGSGTGDLYKIFAVAQRDGLDLNVLSIPPDFELEAEEPFDPVYMKALYDRGYQIGVSGEPWSAYPPDYDPGPS